MGNLKWLSLKYIFSRVSESDLVQTLENHTRTCGVHIRPKLTKFSQARVRVDNFVMQHCVGCRVCGAKSSSRFREWQSYSYLEGFQGVEFRRPESSVICEKCHRAATRSTLKVRTSLHQFARSSPFIFTL